MKNIIYTQNKEVVLKTLLLLALNVFMLSSLYAKTWRVNNTAEVNADFTTAQAAHDDVNVVSGDTLLFEGSPDSYGDITLYKKLAMIGTGYFLGENPGHQALLSSAKLGNVTFSKETGSAPSASDPDGVPAVSSSGSTIVGLEVFSIRMLVSNITIRRCYITSDIGIDMRHTDAARSPITANYFTSNANNTVIIDCYLPTRIIFVGRSDNVIISNNVTGFITNEGTSSNVTLTNNIIDSGQQGASIKLYNAIIRNNILLKGIITPYNSIYSNNLASSDVTGLPAGNDNVGGYALGDLFAASYVGGEDAYYQLPAASVAKGAGFNGVDCGIFGGPSPYVLSGIPPIPTIYEFTAPAIGSTTEGLQIQVKIKSNN